MNKKQWTPGPWLYDECLVYSMHKDGYNHFWANYFTQHEYAPQSEMIANARLCAAAPDLYEALERCLEYIEVDEDGHGRKFGEGNHARAALAKARGEVE